ncbi:MAG: tetratricopeptide repeat protein [Bacteroidetes bacterium]|jgi:tetratricopeptide (TPR) repeat protein|nr:tetratricopeptide repeat protein [Bacteroidota bacterium]
MTSYGQMTYQDYYEKALEYLKERGRLSNEELLKLVDSSFNYMQGVRRDLLESGWAVEEGHTHLLLSDTSPSIKNQSYDIFISYAHADNQEGRVDELVEQIRDIHREHYHDHLHIFYDREGIKTADDWEHQILTGLKQSKVMIAVITPNYFESDYCRKEWKHFIDQERDYALEHEGMANVYTVTFPEFEDKDLEDIPDVWPRDILRRQFEDLRPWWNEGEKALKRQQVLERIRNLEMQVYDRIEKAKRHQDSAGHLPPRNSYFAGRMEEKRALTGLIQTGSRSTMAVIQGVAGMGKSALAIEYAHAHARHYTGGRYHIPADQINDLRSPLINRADLFGVELTDEEKKDTEKAFLKVRAAIEDGDPLLLIYDNLDNPDLLRKEVVSAHLPHADHIHIVATTRAAAIQYQDYLPTLQLEPMSREDALWLLEKRRSFTDKKERLAAEEIVEALGGYAFAMEAVGIFLQKMEESYQDYLLNMKKKKISLLDEIGQWEEVSSATAHPESMISRLWKTVLDSMEPEELVALQYAALLPPDHVVLPWVEELSKKQRNGKGLKKIILRIKQLFKKSNNTEKTYENRISWNRISRRMQGLGIWSATEDRRIVRMHRLLQAIINDRFNNGINTQPKKRNLLKYMDAVATDLTEAWHRKDQRWKIDPLFEYAKLFLDDPLRVYPITALNIFHNAWRPVSKLGRHTDAKIFYREVVSVAERVYKYNSSHPNLGSYYSNMGTIEVALGQYEIAHEWIQKAVDISEQFFKSPHSHLVADYSNMGMIEKKLGHYEVARGWMQKAVDIGEQFFKSPHPDLGSLYSNLGTIEQDLEKYVTAREWMQKAIDNAEQLNDPPHPFLGVVYSNMGMIEKDLGQYEAAREWTEKAIANDEQLYELPHSHLGIRYSNMGYIERDLAHFEIAHEWMQKAIANDEQVYDPPHPSLGTVYSNMGLIEQDLGQYEAAREWTEKAIGNNEQLYDPPHPDLGAVYSIMGSIEQDLGQYELACEWMQKAVDQHEQVFEPPHSSLGTVYSNMGLIEQDLGHYEAAREWMEKAIANDEQVYDPPHQFLGYYLARNSEIHLALGNVDQSKNCIEEAFESHFILLDDADSKYEGVAYRIKAEIEHRTGNTEEAVEFIQRANHLLHDRLPENHRERNRIQELMDEWGVEP